MQKYLKQFSYLRDESAELIINKVNFKIVLTFKILFATFPITVCKSTEQVQEKANGEDVTLSTFVRSVAKRRKS